MIRYTTPVEKPESKKGLKPKPVTRPKGKEVDRVVRDMQPAGRGGLAIKLGDSYARH